jgi:hypothetical protein
MITPANTISADSDDIDSRDQELPAGFVSSPVTLPSGRTLQCVPSCGDVNSSTPDGVSRAVVVMSENLLLAPWYKLVAADAFGAVGADAGRYWVADNSPSMLLSTIVPTPVLVNAEAAGIPNDLAHPGGCVLT